MTKKSQATSASYTDNKTFNTKKKRRGLQASLENFLQKFIEYLEALLLYAQRHTEQFLRSLIFKGIWFICLFFTICIGFGYLSFSTFLAFQIYAGLSIIQASLSTGLVFLLGSFLFLKFLLSKK